MFQVFVVLSPGYGPGPGHPRARSGPGRGVLGRDTARAAEPLGGMGGRSPPQAGGDGDGGGDENNFSQPLGPTPIVPWDEISHSGEPLYLLAQSLRQTSPILFQKAEAIGPA